MTPALESQANGAGRLGWIEAMRWVAAGAVVYQHSLEQLCLRSLATDSPSAAWLIHSALRFPVPVFFFLSGLVAGISIRAGRDVPVLRRAMRTAIPYFVFSLLYTLIALADGRLGGLSMTQLATRVALADDASILWFLASLTVVAPLSVLMWKR